MCRLNRVRYDLDLIGTACRMVDPSAELELRLQGLAFGIIGR